MSIRPISEVSANAEKRMQPVRGSRRSIGSQMDLRGRRAPDRPLYRGHPKDQVMADSSPSSGADGPDERMHHCMMLDFVRGCTFLRRREIHGRDRVRRRRPGDVWHGRADRGVNPWS